MFILFPLTECCVFDHPRHEDVASSCTATKFNCVEDGRDFRGTSKGMVAFYHVPFVFFQRHLSWGYEIINHVDGLMNVMYSKL